MIYGLNKHLIPLLGFCILLPFAYWDNILDPVRTPRLVLWSAFLSIAFLSIKRMELRVTSNRDFIFISLILVSLIFTLWQSINFPEALQKALTYIFPVLQFILIRHGLRTNTTSKKEVSIAILITSAMLALMGFRESMLFFMDKGTWPIDENAINATLMNKNALATCLFLSIPFLHMFYMKSEKHMKWISLSLMALTFILLVSIQAKSTLLGLILFLIIYIATRIQKNVENQSIKKIIPIGSLLALLLLSALMTRTSTFKSEWEQLNFSVEKLTKEESFETVESSSISRFALYYITTQMIAEKPLLGYGPGNWRICFPCRGLAQFGGDVKEGLINYQHPHSFVLQIFSEFGVIVGFILLMLYLNVILRLYQNLRSTGYQLNHVMAFAFSLALIPLLLLDNTIFRPLPLIMISTSMAFLPDNKHPQRIAWNVRALPFSVVALILSLSMSSVLRSEYYAKKLFTSNVDESLNYAERAKTNIYELNDYSMPIDWYAGVAQYVSQDFNSSKSSFIKASISNPCQIHIWNNLASSYVQLNQLEKAVEVYNKALNISPKFEESLINLAAVHYNLNALEKAKQTILSVDPSSQHGNYKSYALTIVGEYLHQAYPDSTFSNDEIWNYILENTSEE